MQFCLFDVHFFLKRKFLNAGKHVCVEYPMALSVAAAGELWDLADAKGNLMK